MAATPCLKDFFDDEILNAIETEKRIEPVQQPFSMTAIPVMEAENIFEPEKMQVELPVCENQKILLAWMTMNLNCLWISGCCTGSIRFSVSMVLSISSSIKSFGCCTGSIRFSASMALSISSSKKSFRQGIVKI